MNTDPDSISENQRVVAEAAAAYTPPEPQSHTLLKPHRESIAMLRSKGASYRAIVKILGKVNIRVSLDTLSRFCRENIEHKSTRRGLRRPGPYGSIGQTESPLPVPPMPNTPAPAKAEKAAEPAAPPRGKGPRIADPNNI